MKWAHPQHAQLHFGVRIAYNLKLQNHNVCRQIKKAVWVSGTVWLFLNDHLCLTWRVTPVLLTALRLRHSIQARIQVPKHLLCFAYMLKPVNL